MKELSLYNINYNSLIDYNSLSVCLIDTQTDRQTHRQTDTQTQTDRHRDRHAHTQTDRQR